MFVEAERLRVDNREKAKRIAELEAENRRMREALEEIAAGHNDPRALARQVLAMYPEGGR